VDASTRQEFARIRGEAVVFAAHVRDWFAANPDSSSTNPTGSDPLSHHP
jgi:hypothetical protein